MIDFHFMAEEGWIDAHAHVWSDDTARYPLGEGYRKEQMRPARFEPEELLAHARPCGVSRIVLIQMSYYRFDNAYMLDAMARYPGTFGGVAVVDAGRREAPERMRELKERGVRGFRILAPEVSAPAMEAMWECAAREELAICPLINPPELAALEWMCAKHPRTPVVIDGFISGAAALVAARIAPKAVNYMIASHLSQEPGHRLILEMLDLEPMLQMKMRLGEGTGAVLAFHLVEAATRILREMATFAEAGVSGALDG